MARKHRRRNFTEELKINYLYTIGELFHKNSQTREWICELKKPVDNFLLRNKYESLAKKSIEKMWKISKMKKIKIEREKKINFCRKCFLFANIKKYREKFYKFTCICGNGRFVPKLTTPSMYDDNLYIDKK